MSYQTKTDISNFFTWWTWTDAIEHMNKYHHHHDDFIIGSLRNHDGDAKDNVDYILPTNLAIP